MTSGHCPAPQPPGSALHRLPLARSRGLSNNGTASGDSGLKTAGLSLLAVQGARKRRAVIGRRGPAWRSGGWPMSVGYAESGWARWDQRRHRGCKAGAVAPVRMLVNVALPRCGVAAPSYDARNQGYAQVRGAKSSYPRSDNHFSESRQTQSPMRHNSIARHLADHAGQHLSRVRTDFCQEGFHAVGKASG